MAFKMPDRKWVIMAALIPLMVVIVLPFHDSILYAIGDFLVIRDKLRPADVIHVIAGHDNRTDFAVHFYQQGYARQIFFTGGWCTYYKEYHGERGKNAAVKEGIPIKAIATDESEVRSTYDEVLRLKDFIAQSPLPIRSVIVVSDPYHMRRARWTYRQILGDGFQIDMAPVPFSETPYQRKWWTDLKSRDYVKKEYIKMAYYYARYQFSSGCLRDWLASLDRD